MVVGSEVVGSEVLGAEVGDGVGSGVVGSEVVGETVGTELVGDPVCCSLRTQLVRVVLYVTPGTSDAPPGSLHVGSA